jgi:hypothetical protein
MQNIRNEIFDEYPVHLVPGVEAAQVLSVCFAFDEPGVVIACRALEIRIFLFDVADEGVETPPLPSDASRLTKLSCFPTGFHSPRR